MLGKLLSELPAQTLPIHRVIVVDNGSSDDSVMVAKRAGADVIELSANTGFSRAVNLGIQSARADWIAILNNDVSPSEDWLRNLVQQAEAANAWFAAGKLLDASAGHRIEGAFDAICRGACAWRCGHGRPDSVLWNQPREIRFAPFTAAIFRAELFQRVGLLDEEFESYLEDIDFGKPLTQALIDKLSEGRKIPQPLLDNFGGGIIPEMVHRYAQPAGGLYSTASDVGRFCQMLLNGGTWHGRRYLSEEAIKTMSTNQTGDVTVNPNEGYSVGLFVKKKDDEGPAPGSYGHRGARRTVMWIDPAHQLAMVALLQRMDMSGEQQKEFYGSVFRAMVEKFGRKQ